MRLTRARTMLRYLIAFTLESLQLVYWSCNLNNQLQNCLREFDANRPIRKPDPEINSLIGRPASNLWRSCLNVKNSQKQFFLAFNSSKNNLIWLISDPYRIRKIFFGGNWRHHNLLSRFSDLKSLSTLRTLKDSFC